MRRLAGASLCTYALSASIRARSMLGETRRGAIIELCFDDDSLGFADLAPLPGRSRETLAEAVDATRRWLAERIEMTWPVASRPISELPGGDGPLPPSASWALAVAGGSTPDVRVSTALLLGDASSLDVRGVGADTRTVKVKIGGCPLAEDIVHLARLREQLPHVNLRLDANRRLTQAALESHAAELESLQIEFLEEPLADPRASLTVGQRCALPVALDETTAERDADHQWDRLASAFVLKPTLLGFERTLAWLTAAGQLDKPVIISSSFESRLGIEALARVQAHWAPQVAAGLGTSAYLADDLVPVVSDGQGIIHAVWRADLAAHLRSHPALRCIETLGEKRR